MKHAHPRRPGAAPATARTLPLAPALALALALALLAGIAPASTVTSGMVLDASSGTPVPWGWVGLIRQSTLDSLPPGESVWPDLIADIAPGGNYAFLIDDTDPTFQTFYVFSLSPEHFNRIHADVVPTYAFPFKEDFSQPGVVPLDGRQPNPGIDFSLPSNMTTTMVLMRDGVTHLATDVYLARKGGQDPAILIRTVYDKDNSASQAYYTLFGYHVVIQDSRGRFASEGIDPVFRDDAWGENQDGYDTVEWVASRPYSNGKVGMLGGSALAITQYLTAGAAPPSLACCFAVVGTGYSYDAFFTGGVFRKYMIESWLEGQGSMHFLPDLEAHPNRDSWWDEVDISTRLAEIRVPFLHMGGWFDIFQEGTTRAFEDLQHQGGPGALGNQKLLVGPWTHGGIHSRQQGELVFPPASTDDGGFSDGLLFFDYWLKGIDRGYSALPAVRYWVLGDVDDPSAPGNEWRDADDWPPPAVETPFFFWPDGTLGPLPPLAPSLRAFAPPSVSYLYDPADPAPTLGGANLSLPAGPYDQSPIEARPDVVTFTSDPLASPLEVTGHLEADLYIASSAPDTDFMVKLCDVYPDGRSMLIQEGAFRARHRVDDRSEHLLEPGRMYAVTIDLWSTSIVFNTGHRIRVSVTSSNDPRWDPNPNTGEPFRQQTRLDVARNTIYCAPGAPSRILLPIPK